MVKQFMDEISQNQPLWLCAHPHIVQVCWVQPHKYSAKNTPNFLLYQVGENYLTLIDAGGTVTGYCRKKFMKDISTAEADSRKCWVSKYQKFHAKFEFGSL